MSNPTVVKVEPPVATTLRACDMDDIVRCHDRLWIVAGYQNDQSRWLLSGGLLMAFAWTTPVLLVARVQLEGRGK